MTKKRQKVFDTSRSLLAYYIFWDNMLNALKFMEVIQKTSWKHHLHCKHAQTNASTRIITTLPKLDKSLVLGMTSLFQLEILPRYVVLHICFLQTAKCHAMLSEYSVHQDEICMRWIIHTVLFLFFSSPGISPGFTECATETQRKGENNFSPKKKKRKKMFLQ